MWERIIVPLDRLFVVYPGSAGVGEGAGVDEGAGRGRRGYRGTQGRGMPRRRLSRQLCKYSSDCLAV